MFHVDLDKKRRVVMFRAEGTLSPQDLEDVLKECVRVTDMFKNGQHIVFADMRGLKPLGPEAAQILGQIIRYGREHGTVLCVHISDSSIQKLQAGRLAREASPDDVATINVVSPEEGWRVVDERYRALTGPMVA
jgi:hypothetical protein